MALEVSVGGSGELFVGEDKIFRAEILDVSQLPVNISTWAIKMIVRKKDGTADPAIFDKSASIVGVFNATRALNTQRAEVQLTDTELNTVKARGYRWSWKRMDDGSETVLLWGDFAPQKATAP